MQFSRAKELALLFKKEISDDDVTGLAAELTYRAFLALFPFVIFLAALGSVIVKVVDMENPAQKFIDLFGERLPADAASILTEQVTGVIESPNAGLLSFGILGALWASMGGAGAVIKAMNRAYDLSEGRGFLKQKLAALAITLLGVLAVFVAVGVIFTTQFFRDEIADRIGLGREFRFVAQIASIPMVVVAIAIFTTVIYRLAPNTRLSMRDCAAGAVIFAIGWGLLTVAFGFYVRNFGSYNATYGALAGVVVLLFWFYLTNILLLVGAEYNALASKLSREAAVPAAPGIQQAALYAAAADQFSAPRPALAPALAPPAEPNRVGVLVGLVAVLITAATFLKYLVFRCPREHTGEAPATASPAGSPEGFRH